ncbi:uncharacterized protein RCC_06885 [Ramularia collo-cygni]|uniref:Cyanovirin-N domain-containing protein n=1 Tax=Ramularia collo-cygni TaxID=112498 RepID=A0A2D3VDX9_9PEZI|nr:uncharacterized protein RCC_06885 [Ramularia collo-cygni]CZT21024.1 uncharacterized protein RCC_06885 [Ramularia collo-cygni]
MAASVTSALLFSLLSLVSASPYPLLAVRQEAISQCPSGAPGFATIGASCIRSGGSAYVKSLCGAYPPLTTVTESITATTTESFTVTSAAQTVYTPPPISRTVLSCIADKRSTTTEIVTATNGTRTTHVATNTITDTITATQYTCPITSLIGIVARQAGPSSSLAAPSCLSEYRDERGREGIRDACSCLIAARSTGTTTITLAIDTATSSATNTILGTTTIRGTTIVTNITTAYATVTRTDTMTTTVPHITAHVSTTTVLTTVTTILPTPTPSRFRLYYNSTSTSPSSGLLPKKIFAGKVPAPGDPTVSELGFSNATRAGDIFTLNRNNELVDVTFGRTITTRNKQDAYPFLFLNRDEDIDADDSLIIPTCSVCSGVLTCGSQSRFAVCLSQQLLTLGPAGNWAGNGTDCKFVELGLEAVGGNVTRIGF